MTIIKSFSVGNGDMFYINHASDNFSIIDCHYHDEVAKENNFNEIIYYAKKKGITRFISTHPDEDHLKGLSELDKKIKFKNFYCVKNNAIEKSETRDFKKYCELRDSDKTFYIKRGCARKWLNESDDERGGSGISFLWPNVANKHYIAELEKAKKGIAFNNLSPIFKLSTAGGAKVMWMGDIESSFLEAIKNDVNWCEVDILFAPHHGRDSGKVPTDVLKVLNPQLIIVGEAPSKHLNYYDRYNTITQNSAGDIVFECDNGCVNIYVSSKNYKVDFLKNQRISKKSYGNYIGTLSL